MVWKWITFVIVHDDVVVAACIAYTGRMTTL
jgi:hypothetical protein